MATIWFNQLDGLNGETVTVDATTGGNSGFHVKTGAWVYDTAVKAAGTASAKVTVANATALLTRTNSTTITKRYYDFCYRISDLTPGEIEIALVRMGGIKTAGLRISATGKLSIRDANTSMDVTATTIVANQWFRIQWGIDGTVQTARLWVSSTLADLFNNPPTETIGGQANSYTGGTWDSFRIGTNTAYTATINVDRVLADGATWPVSGGSGNVAPTANAGADTSCASGETIALAGSGTDPDGTIASYAWVHVSGPVGSFSDAAIQNPNWTAPIVSTATDVVLGLRVTDNAGAQSVVDTKTVSVAAVVSGTPTEDWYEGFNAGPSGATITTLNTLLTTVSGGITFANDAIGEGLYAATASPAGGSKVMQHSLAAAASVQYADGVFKVSNLTAVWTVMRALSGITARASVRVNTDGTITLRNGTTAGGDSTPTTATISAGVPFRIAWHLNNGGNMELRLFSGSNLWGTTPDVGGSISQAQNTGTFDIIEFGNSLAATGTWVVDSLRVDATSWPAPWPDAVGAGHSNLWIAQTDGTWAETPFEVLA